MKSDRPPTRSESNDRPTPQVNRRGEERSPQGRARRRKRRHRADSGLRSFAPPGQRGREVWHLTFARPGRGPLAFSEQERRDIVRTLVSRYGLEMVLFCVVDDHLHDLVLCSRGRAGRLCQSLTLALDAIVPGIEANEPWPVEDRNHMESLVPYVLRQVWRHGVVGADPALWSGSCFQDLVGARLLPGLALQIGAALPRFRLETGVRAAELPGPPRPLSDGELRALGGARIASAAADALCVGPGLTGNAPPVVRARRAAAQLAGQVELSREETAWALGIAQRSVRRLQALPADVQAQRAVATRLALEQSVAAARADGRGREREPGQRR